MCTQKLLDVFDYVRLMQIARFPDHLRRFSIRLPNISVFGFSLADLPDILNSMFPTMDRARSQGIEQIFFF